MANDVAEYLSGLPDAARAKIGAIYAEARRLVPDAVEGVSYGMPSLLYKGKGLLSVMNTKKHIGVYPYGNLGELADAVAAAGLNAPRGRFICWTTRASRQTFSSTFFCGAKPSSTASKG